MQIWISITGLVLLLSYASSNVRTREDTKQAIQCIYAGFRQTSRTCRDVIDECDNCKSESACQQSCANDKKCKGYLFWRQYRRCGKWMGRKCPQYDAEFTEKICQGETGVIDRDDPGFTIRALNLKEENNEDLKPIRKCPLQCAPIPVVEGALHNGKSNKIGSLVTYYCMNELVLEGKTRTIQCRPDGHWDHPPYCVQPVVIPDESANSTLAE